MLNVNIETFIACDKSYDAAEIVLFGAPFDSTTSNRPGTRFASKAIRNESFGLETYSPYLDRDLVSDSAVFDSGDLELSFGSTSLALDSIEERSTIILDDGKLPFMIGGEHLVTLGSLRALHKRYPDLNVIQFDAHTDLREDYLGVPLSHACVMRRAYDLFGEGHLYQFGIRSGEREEFAWAKQHSHLQKFDFTGLEQVVADLRGKPVYFTLDLDVLDPSCFPGTGTPEAGGVSFLELLAAMRRLSGLNIVGCDVNELSPAYDPSGVSTATACKVIRELLLILSSKGGTN